MSESEALIHQIHKWMILIILVFLIKQELAW